MAEGGATGSKKRGISGKSNAENSPYRLNGLPPDWQARKLGVYRQNGAASSGSTTMRGFVGGMLAEAMGYPMAGSTAIYERMLAHAERRVTHPLLQIGGDNA